MHKHSPGDRIHHRRRDQSGTFLAVVRDDRSGNTVLVRFDEAGDDEKVSRDQLSKVAQ